MKNTTIATIRTALPAGWGAVVIWGANKAGLNIEADDLVTLAPAVVVVTGVVYRLSRVLEDRWPKLGYVLFGRNTPPSY